MHQSRQLGGTLMEWEKGTGQSAERYLNSDPNVTHEPSRSFDLASKLLILWWPGQESNLRPSR
jgi:hypothetical protein